MVSFSFEFFPPKNDVSEKKFWLNLDILSNLNPNFISITCSCLKNLKNCTHELIKKIKLNKNLSVSAHITCVNSTKDEIKNLVSDYIKIGVKDVVAVRGDMPDFKVFKPYPKGFLNCVDMIKSIKKQNLREISVSAYPENHPESINFDKDVDFLKAKIDAGATRTITQFSFNTESHLRYRDKLRKENISIPILPGIMPTTNFENIKNFSKVCGAKLPNWLMEIYEKSDNNIDTRKKIATSIAENQCQTLKKEGFNHFHFYTMNGSDVIKDVCKSLNS